MLQKEHDLLIPFHNGLLIIWVCKKKLSTSLLYWFSVLPDLLAAAIWWHWQPTITHYKSDVESFFLHTQIISKPFAELVELVYAPFGKNNRALDSGMTAD